MGQVCKSLGSYKNLTWQKNLTSYDTFNLYRKLTDLDHLANSIFPLDLVDSIRRLKSDRRQIRQLDLARLCSDSLSNTYVNQIQIIFTLFYKKLFSKIKDPEHLENSALQNDRRNRAEFSIPF